MTNQVRMLVGLVLLAALAGCAKEPVLIGRPDLTIASGELPAPTTADLIGEPRPYLIGPLDELLVDVYGVPDLSRKVQVDASGRIAMPLIGVLQASGKTPSELGAAIRDQFKQYVRDPDVTVNLVATVSQVVTIDGAVGAPGQFPVVGRMTLMRAIARASGVTEFARENYVVVFRRVNNKDMAALYDLRAIRQGAYADPEIFANDVVLVGDSPSRRFFKNIVGLAPLLSAPLIAVLQ